MRLGKTPRKSDYRNHGALKIIKFRDILENGEIDWDDVEKGFVADEPSALAGMREVRAGDVLVTASAHMSEHIGKKSATVQSIPPRFLEVFVVGEVLQVRTKPSVDPRWVLNYIRSRDGCKAIQERVNGVHLIASRAREIEVPVTDLEDQRRIVAKIEKQFSRLDEAVANLKRVRSRLRSFEAAALREAFDSSPSESAARLLDACHVVSGFAFKSEDVCAEGVPVVKIANVGYGEFVWKDQQYLPDKFLGRYAAFEVRPGDVLLALTRPVTEGTLKVCRYPDDAPRALLNQRVALLRTVSPVDAKYLLAQMRSPAFRRKLLEAVSQTLQPNLSPVVLKQFTIRWPAERARSTIAAEVDRRLSIVRELEAEVDANLKRAQALRQAVLARAFRT